MTTRPEDNVAARVFVVRLDANACPTDTKAIPLAEYSQKWAVQLGIMSCYCLRPGEPHQP